MKHKKPQQKLISFSDSQQELAIVEQDMKDGWHIVSLTSHGRHYVGIMEKTPAQPEGSEDISIFIPSRKKIRFV